MLTSRPSWKAITLNWRKANPKSWPITIKKQAIISGPSAAGSNSGQRALTHSANVEAIASFRKALQLLNALPETADRIKQEIEIQLALGIPLIAVQGYASAETREAFSRARILCLKLGDVPEYFQALFGLWGHAWMSGKNDDALRMADEFVSRARAFVGNCSAHGGSQSHGQHFVDLRRFPILSGPFRKRDQAFGPGKTAAVQPIHG